MTYFTSPSCTSSRWILFVAKYWIFPWNGTLASALLVANHLLEYRSTILNPLDVMCFSKLLWSQHSESTYTQEVFLRSRYACIRRDRIDARQFRFIRLELCEAKLRLWMISYDETEWKKREATWEENQTISSWNHFIRSRKQILVLWFCRRLSRGHFSDIKVTAIAIGFYIEESITHRKYFVPKNKPKFTRAQKEQLVLMSIQAKLSVLRKYSKDYFANASNTLSKIRNLMAEFYQLKEMKTRKTMRRFSVGVVLVNLKYFSGDSSNCLTGFRCTNQ